MSQAMTPALSVTRRIWCVVRSSTKGTGQPEPCSTTSIRQGALRGAGPTGERGAASRTMVRMKLRPYISGARVDITLGMLAQGELGRQRRLLRREVINNK